jgi:hypothetical protein
MQAADDFKMRARRGHNAAVNWQDFGTPRWQLAVNTTPISALLEGVAMSARPTPTEDRHKPLAESEDAQAFAKRFGGKRLPTGNQR